MRRTLLMLEDKLLIWKYRRGNVDALRQIYDKYKSYLLKLAVALTADISLAEDVVQDVFARLAEAHDRIGIQGNLKNYLITCLTNRIRTLRRDGQRHAAKTPAIVERTNTASQGPDQWAELNEEMQLLTGALAQLPFEQRETITLRFEAGMRFRQIAQVQGVSANTVHGRYRYGMEKLRSLLNSEIVR